MFEEEECFRHNLLFETPVNAGTTNAQVGNVIKDGRRHIDRTASTPGAQVYDPTRSVSAIAFNENIFAAVTAEL